MQASKYDKGKIIKWQREDKKRNHYTLKQLMKKEATDLKESMEQYIAGLGGRRGKGKYCNYIMINSECDLLLHIIWVPLWSTRILWELTQL